MSFYCDKCGFHNNEIQPGGKLKDKGVKYNLRCTNPKDLNRDVVKSEHAILNIPELNFEASSIQKKGLINTVEGLLQKIIDDLSEDQETRKVKHNN